MKAVDGLADTAESAGVRVGPYRLLARLGVGGMGEVWSAYDDVLRREIAIKVLKAARAGTAESRSRMLREARAQAALNHPNICTIYQAGEGDNGVWIAMERLPGPTLAELASKGPIEVGRIARWGMQIAQALAAAHAVGLAHRDLKPSNAMLAAGGAVKLLDFGLAKRLEIAEDETAAPDEDRTVQTEDGRVIGTPRYMSPEQAAGDAVGTPSDIFSFGVMMFELVARRPPFAAATPVEVMARIISEEAPQLATSAPDTPPELASIVQACLARRIEDRPSANDVATALAVLADSSSTAVPLAKRPPGRWVAVAVGLAFVSAIAVVAVALVQRSTTTARAMAPDAAIAIDAAVAAPVQVATGRVSSAAFSGGHLVFIADRRAWVSTHGAQATPLALAAEPLRVSCCVDGTIVVQFEASSGLLDLQTRGVTPSERDTHDSPDRALTADLSLHEIAIQSSSGARASIASSPPDELFSALRWSPDSKHLAWLRNSAELVQIEVWDVAAKSAIVVAKLGRASSGASQSLAWRGAKHLVAMQHAIGGSILVEIDVFAQPKPALRPLARWPDRIVDLLAIEGTTVAVTETGVRFEVMTGALEAGHISWSEPFEGLQSPGVWARDGRVIAGRYNAQAKSMDIVVASRGGAPAPLVMGTSDAFLALAASTATGILYTRFTSTSESSELWTSDFSGREAKKVTTIGREDVIACGGAHCAILERTGTTARLRELDPITGVRGKPLFETSVGVGETKDIGASPDGERFVVPVEDGVVIVPRTGGKPRRIAIDDADHVLSADLTADPAVMLVADAHAPEGFALSRVTGSRTQVLATDATYFNISTSADDTQILVTRQRTPGGLWTETVPVLVE